MSMKSILINLNSTKDITLLNQFPNIKELHIDNSDSFPNRVVPPTRIKKLIGCLSEKISFFLKINQSIETFKSLLLDDHTDPNSMVCDLTDANHIRNLILQTSLNTSNNLLSYPNYKLESSVSKFSYQEFTTLYLKRIKQ
ncbi:hypothetical protein DFA_06457 [Cavenderia fasciculata]|uniref:Uncharacterized protein n=1 Tax=Cavenderia fasciculata TaxID=261658 RepID=F4PJ21_CACFS|nr:uncharacterized protein DFA_06457 [Cavenderia fasciculata]EGG24307.1 hypothetical protein DFA_06457 [Cavenderia fasciculata]|eukprot:XP_004362158.1 hypothetical protein DFA_06457 [Cavenderia fasciculata]